MRDSTSHKRPRSDGLHRFGNEERFARELLEHFESPFEAATVRRSSAGELAPGIWLQTCSAEDLVVHKAFASRPQDWVDIEGVVVRQRGELNWQQIDADLRWLVDLKGEPEILAQLDRVVHRAEQSLGFTIRR